MGSRPVTIEIPDEVRVALEETADDTGRPLSSLAADMLSEAMKMRRVPGIVFADGPAGRRARIAGTGLEVFEIISQYRASEGSWQALKTAFHWLNDWQLQAALAFYEAYPTEVDAFLEGDDIEAIRAVWEKYSALKPPWR